MTSKRLVLAVLCLLIAAGMVFANGGTQSGGATGSASGIQTVVIGIQRDTMIPDYQNNYLTQYLEKLHNIRIQFYDLPTDGTEVRTKVSLMVAANDLPDILITNSLTQEQVLDYGSKGAFLALDKYMSDPSKTPYFAAIPKADKDLMLDAMTSSDGHIYGFAQFQPETWNMTAYRYYLNREWLKNLGLAEPKTTDELRNVLLAFRDRDPNGNGRRDEIGVYGYFDGGYGENVIAALINSFVYYNPGNLALDASGSKVIAPWTEPGFRKALQYLNTLYKDGVLAASTFTDDQQTFRATLNNNPTIVGLTSMGSIGNLPGAAQQDNNAFYKQVAPLYPPFTGPDGISYTPYSEQYPGLHAFIPTKSKIQDLCVKILDSFYEENLSTIVRFGEEGVDWSRKPEDLVKVTNDMVQLGAYPALTLVQIQDIWTKPSNKHWHNIGPRYTPLEKGNTIGNLESPFDGRYYSSTHNAVNYQYYYPLRPQYLLPTLKYSYDDALKVSEPITNINDYVRQSIAEFVISSRDINNDTLWNAYLRELDNMGQQTWLQAAQATFNRQRR
jgi:putative aldouronate transport system substrate-binding protein